MTTRLTPKMVRHVVRRVEGKKPYVVAELAEDCGVTTSPIYALLNGKTRVDITGWRGGYNGRRRRPKMTAKKAGALVKACARGMTQADAAAKYGVSQGTVSRIVNGKTFYSEDLS